MVLQQERSSLPLDKRRDFNKGPQRNVRTDLNDPAPSCAMMHSSSGDFVLTSSRASFQAQDPLSDTILSEVDGTHAFVVVMNADFTARGQSYLSRNLFREVQTQIKAADGDLARAFLAAMSTLDQAFRRIHPFNGPVLEGVRIAAAYLDAASSTVHLASNGGGALCLCGSRQSDGSCSVTASIGTTGPATHNPTECSSQSLHLDSSVDTIMVASPGFWQEVSPSAAAERLLHYKRSIPAANGGNAAAHLINYAMHNVTQRLRSAADPRMRSLKEVYHLHSLMVGNKANYKSAHRQVLRRRRGDVHGDMSAAVLQLSWEGLDAAVLSTRDACRLQHSQSATSVEAYSRQQPRAKARWAHLRMHFLEFQKAHKQTVRNKWHSLVQEACLQSQASAKGLHMQQKPAFNIRANSSRDMSLVAVSA